MFTRLRHYLGKPHALIHNLLACSRRQPRPRLRAKAQYHGKGSLGFCLDRRSASFAGWIASGVRARDREREEGRLQHFHLVRAGSGGRGAASINEGRSRLDATLVAGRKISPFPARDREGWKTGTAPIVDAADGRRRLVFVYRSAKGRRQSRLVAGWKIDRVHE